MAREQVKDGVLRGCPTCGTPVSEVDMGLRDFRWLNQALPGKVGFMDIDAVVSQSSSHRTLALELKPKGAPVSRGAKLTFKEFVADGWDVWPVWDQGDGTVKRGIVTPAGGIEHVRLMTQDELAEDVSAWWAVG